MTFELVQDIIKVNPCTKFHDRTPNSSAVRVLTDRQTDAHTHTYTDRTVFITSTADTGGKKYMDIGHWINHKEILKPKLESEKIPRCISALEESHTIYP